MNILFLTSAHNSLSQRLLIELTERGHLIHVRVVATGQEMIDAVSHETPDLIIAPMLKTAIRHCRATRQCRGWRRHPRVGGGPRLYARSGIVLNPHYRGMGELYGSEYWTYLLPKRVGQARALDLTKSCNPMGTKQACEIGFLDDAFGSGVEAFETELSRRAHRIAQDSRYWSMLRKKKDCRFTDEQEKPLSRYRTEELERMKVNFFGPDPVYHEARRRFVFKGRPPAADTRQLAPKIRSPGWFTWVKMDESCLADGC